MAIRVTCDGCGQEYRLSDEMAGKKAKCKACGEAILIPTDDLDDLVDFDVPQTKPKSPPPPLPKQSTASKPPAPPPLPKSASPAVSLPKISLTCDVCFADFQTKGELAGKKAKCPECGELVSVPGSPKGKVSSKPKPAEEDVWEADEVIEDEFEDEDEEIRPKKSTKASKKGKSTARNSSKKSSRGESFFLDDVPTPLLLGGMWTVILIMCALFFVFGRNRGAQNAFAGEAGNDNGGGFNANANAPVVIPQGGPMDPYDLTAIPVPPLPEPGPFRSQDEGLFQYTEATFNGAGPGGRMQLRLRLPNGIHAPQSLGCILVGGAGTPMIWGCGLQDVDYTAESQPYLNAGFAVCDFSIDGEQSEDEDDVDTAGMITSHQQFSAACAGVVNVRNALEFILAKIAVVNPNRIYIAGHSSAGALALLAAAHEPRLKACIAYAAPTELVGQQQAMLNAPGFSQVFPQMSEFLRRSSPMTHVARMQCPVYLFHALDDSTVPVNQSQLIASQLQSTGKIVTMETVPTGEHYQAMVNQGLLKAVAWLKTLPTEQPGGAAASATPASTAPMATGQPAP